MKTSELDGLLLDYWVARAEGFAWANDIPPQRSRGVPAYSTNWAEGGPIIERERIAVFSADGRADGGAQWGAEIRGHDLHWIDTDIFACDARGKTPLIAAMRAYVVSKFGDTVPDEVPA